MELQRTTAVEKIQRLQKRLRILQGGARAGKTIAILMCLIDLAQSNPDLVISVVSETLPHLKRGAIRDFLMIMNKRNYYEDDRWNRSDLTYRFPNGSIIEFFSADSPDKVRGPARHILFINECNNVIYEIYRQLAMRTSLVVYLDFNPVNEFWVHTKLLQRTDAEFEKLTYLDNEALPKAIVREIESLKSDPNMWRIYGLGEIGVNEGQIYNNWHDSDSVPAEARLVRYALDFGYTNDPTALVGIYEYDGGYIIDEVAYVKGMSNKQIADLILAQPGYRDDMTLVVADSSEPKSIDEIKLYGVNITGADKGKGSVNQGIQTVQVQKITVTKRSLNIKKEYRNYLWKKDKNGDPLNVPIDLWNHAMDAIRYGLTDLIGNPIGDFPDVNDDDEDYSAFSGGGDTIFSGLYGGRV